MDPFAWQSNKAVFFYFTQNSVSDIQFSTRIQRLKSGYPVTWEISKDFRNSVRRTRMKIKYIFLIINCNITLSIMSLRFIYAVACVRISSFLRLDSTPIFGICYICLPIYPSTDTWVGSTFWLQWITLLWTAFKVCKHLFETLHSILLRVVVKSLSHVQLFATPWTAVC